MSVWRRFHGHGFPSLVTTNVHQRIPIFEEDAAAQMLLDVIGEVAAEEPILLRAFVIMPDHLHIIMSVDPTIVIGRPVQLIKGRFARRYNRQIGRVGQVWQDRFHEKALRSDKELLAGMGYVEANPLVAGLVDRPEHYPWSSAAPHGGRGPARPRVGCGILDPHAHHS